LRRLLLGGVLHDTFRSADCLLATRRRNIPSEPNLQENAMGKYLLGWVLGVPVVVLVIIYLVMN
jgi:hypothetical protein